MQQINAMSSININPNLKQFKQWWLDKSPQGSLLLILLEQVKCIITRENDFHDFHFFKSIHWILSQQFYKFFFILAQVLLLWS